MQKLFLGRLAASNNNEAVDLIHQLGLVPVTIEEQKQEKKNNSIFNGKKIKSKDLYIFSRQLANLLKTGISLLKASVYYS